MPTGRISEASSGDADDVGAPPISLLKRSSRDSWA
jgi:hypothetical protein